MTRSPCSGTRTPPRHGTGRQSADRRRHRRRALGGTPDHRHRGGHPDADGADRHTAHGREDRPTVAAERHPGHRRAQQHFPGRLLHPADRCRRNAGRADLADLESPRGGPLRHRRRTSGDVHRRARPHCRVVRPVLDNTAGFFLPSAAGTVLDITGRYAIVNGSSPAKQYVGDLGVYTYRPILTRSVTAASVWGPACGRRVPGLVSSPPRT